MKGKKREIKREPEQPNLHKNKPNVKNKN